MKPEKIKCESCGHLLVEYTFSFSTGLLAVLKKLYDAGGPIKIKELGLTYSQWTNGQKLRYWGLAVPHLNAESKIKKGWWTITNLGNSFIRGQVSVNRKVVMAQNKFVRFEGEPIMPWNIDSGWDFHKTYADQVRYQLGPELRLDSRIQGVTNA